MDYMRQALSLAKLALGQSSPNPAVGAVVVKDGEIVGQGYTQPPGDGHAEIVALKQAGEKARGGVLYTTLEPCCHFGRTPPCTQAIVAAGITEVHLSILDPNPLVSGRGEEELARENIKTCIGEHEDEARQINEAYIKHITTGLPFVTAKIAVSLDGKIATRDGDSAWISSTDSRRYVHYLRYTADAIMTGANTVIVDDPALTCRYAGKGGEVRKQPIRVIIDGKGRTPPSARIFTETGKTLLVVADSVEPEKKDALVKAGAELLELPAVDGTINLMDMLKTLGKRDITSIMVEGGGILLGSLFDQGLIDKVITFIAPLIIGGESAKTAVAGKGVGKVADAIKLERVSVENFSEDMMVSGYIIKKT